MKRVMAKEIQRCIDNSLHDIVITGMKITCLTCMTFDYTYGDNQE